MGAAVSVVKDAIKDMDGAKQKEGEIKEALDNMQQMTQDQLDLFYERIGWASEWWNLSFFTNLYRSNASYDAKLIPINKVLSHYQMFGVQARTTMRLVRAYKMQSKTSLPVQWLRDSPISEQTS